MLHFSDKSNWVDLFHFISRVMKMDFFELSCLLRLLENSDDFSRMLTKLQSPERLGRTPSLASGNKNKEEVEEEEERKKRSPRKKSSFSCFCFRSSFYRFVKIVLFGYFFLTFSLFFDLAQRKGRVFQQISCRRRLLGDNWFLSAGIREQSGLRRKRDRIHRARPWRGDLAVGLKLALIFMRALELSSRLADRDGRQWLSRQFELAAAVPRQDVRYGGRPVDGLRRLVER